MAICTLAAARSHARVTDFHRKKTHMAEPLTSRQRAQMRSLAMNLEPAVLIGRQGATDNAVKEIQMALLRTELVKVRVNAEDRAARAALMEEIAVKTDSVLCGATGASALYYRPSDKHLIKLV